MVAPVIHDDLERDLEMLRVTVERYGGVWLRADAPEPAVGTPAAELVTATKEVFARFELPVDVAVAHRIEVHPEGGGRADESLQALHRVAERLLSDDVRRRPMAVVSFSDIGLDARRRELLWALTVQQIPPLLSGAVRLFVPVCAGDVDVPLHCTGEPSLRYAIRRGGAARTARVREPCRRGRPHRPRSGRAARAIPRGWLLGVGSTLSRRRGSRRRDRQRH